MNEKRRPTRGGARRRVWQAIGLLLVPAVLLTIMVVPVHVFAGRLPTHSADMYRRIPPVQLQTAWTELWAFLWLVGLGTVALLRGRQRWAFWEYALPAACLLGGYLAVSGAFKVLDNLDAAGIRPPDRLDWQANALPIASALLCAVIGAAIGRAVVASEPDPLQARGKVRAVWAADLETGWDGWLVIVAKVAPLTLLTGWGSGIALGLAVVAFSAAVALWFRTARIFITPAGVRVRLGIFGLVGWRLPVERIASVGVVPVSVWWPPRWWPNVVLRGGPALALHTTDGWTRVVAMPEAPEAAEVLSGWLPAGGAALRAGAGAPSGVGGPGRGVTG